MDIQGSRYLRQHNSVALKQMLGPQVQDNRKLSNTYPGFEMTGLHCTLLQRSLHSPIPGVESIFDQGEGCKSMSRYRGGGGVKHVPHHKSLKVLIVK